MAGPLMPLVAGYTSRRGGSRGKPWSQPEWWKPWWKPWSKPPWWKPWWSVVEAAAVEAAAGKHDAGEADAGEAAPWKRLREQPRVDAAAVEAAAVEAAGHHGVEPRPEPGVHEDRAPARKQRRRTRVLSKNVMPPFCAGRER